MNISWLTRLYRTLLRLYPSNFRGEFADEMQEVFSQAAGEAANHSLLAVGELFLNELRGLPAAVLSVRQSAWRKMQVAAALPAQFTQIELSWKEVLVTMAVLLLPAVVILANRHMHSSAFGSQAPASLPAGLLFLVIMLVIGILRGFSLRSRPYSGAVITIAAYLFLFQWVADLVSPSLISNFSAPPWDHSTYLLLKIVSTGMFWMVLFCLTLLVVALLAVFNRFQRVCWHIKNDWSLLSFILHGEIVFALLLLFENHRAEWPYIFTSLLCLAAGAWLYLRGVQSWHRSLALFGGLLLAVCVAATGAYSAGPAYQEALLIPRSELGLPWLSVFLSQDGWLEAGRVLIVWLWVLVALLIPSLRSRLQQTVKGPQH
jgi:hypothetical protein